MGYKQDDRRTETRMYIREDGEKKDYKVYYVAGRGTPAIEEPEALGLALWAGCKDFVVKQVLSTEDVMSYPGKKEEQFVRANRYIVVYGCTGPDGRYYEDLGNASLDNIQMSTMRVYAPELAAKRARVRVALFALGLKGLNADIEFPDADHNAPISEETKKQVDANLNFMKKVEKMFEDLGMKPKERVAFLKENGFEKGSAFSDVDEQKRLVKLLKEAKNG